MKSKLINVTLYTITIVAMMLILAAGYNSVVPAYQ